MILDQKSPIGFFKERLLGRKSVFALLLEREREREREREINFLHDECKHFIRN